MLHYTHFYDTVGCPSNGCLSMASSFLMQLEYWSDFGAMGKWKDEEEGNMSV